LNNLTSFSFMPFIPGARAPRRVIKKRDPRQRAKGRARLFFRPGVRVGRWPFARGGRLYPAGMRMSIRFAGRGRFAPRRLTAWPLKAYYSGGLDG
jgi:hypothetical protein